jgi:hypothetical protein
VPIQNPTFSRSLQNLAQKVEEGEEVGKEDKNFAEAAGLMAARITEC